MIKHPYLALILIGELAAAIVLITAKAIGLQECAYVETIRIGSLLLAGC